MSDSRTVRRVHVVDPEHATVTENQRIRIDDGVIVEVGDDPDGPVGTAELDAGHRYAVPGLIDCHVHLIACTADEQALTVQSPAYVTAHPAGELRALLGRGFTTVRDMGGADYGLAAAVAEGLFPGPRVFYGGKALSPTGGHADLRSAGQHAHDPHYWTPGLGRLCDGVTEVRRAVRDEVRKGAAHLKLMLSGGISSLTDRIDALQFDDDEVRTAVREASAAGLYCGAHAYTAAAVNRALRLGVRSIEHGNLIDATSVALFAEHGAFYVPTLVTYAALAEEGTEHGLTAQSHAKVFEVLHGGRQALELAEHAEIPIAFGTDLLGAMRVRQPEEFTIRAEIQSSAAVLRSATTVAARLLGHPGRLGTIAPDALGDVLLAEHDPLDDVRHLAEPEREIAVVLSGGRVAVDRR